MSIVVDNVLYAILAAWSSTPRITIRDVAAQAGVSVATVSKVINERYGVAADTMARVQAVISELGYEASLVAQSLRNHRTNVIGILVADLEPFSAELLKGAADAIRGIGLRAGGLLRRRPRRRHGGLGAALPVAAQRHADRRRRPGHADRGGRATTARPSSPSIRTPASPACRRWTPTTCAARAAGHRAPAGPRPSPDRACSAGRPDLQSAQLREQGYREALARPGSGSVDDLICVGGYDAETSAELRRASC